MGLPDQFLWSFTQYKGFLPQVPIFRCQNKLFYYLACLMGKATISSQNQTNRLLASNSLQQAHQLHISLFPNGAGVTGHTLGSSLCHYSFCKRTFSSNYKGKQQALELENPSVVDSLTLGIVCMVSNYRL